MDIGHWSFLFGSFHFKHAAIGFRVVSGEKISGSSIAFVTIKSACELAEVRAALEFINSVGPMNGQRHGVAEAEDFFVICMKAGQELFIAISAHQTAQPAMMAIGLAQPSPLPSSLNA